MRLKNPLLLFITIALATAFLLFVVPDCLRMHPAACLGTPGEAPLAPGVYRLLHPALDNLFAPNAKPITLLWVDLFLQAVCVALTVPLLHTWLRRWLNPDRALLGVMIFGVVYLMAYHYYYRSISTALEILFVVTALCLLNRSWLWLIPLLILASLNRETSLLLPILYAAWHGRVKWREAGALLLIWGAITAGIHLVIGSFPHQLGLVGTLEYNLGNLPDALIANLLLLPLAWLVVAGYRAADVRLKRFVWVVAVYVLAIAVGGALNETQRLILPVLPLLIPVMLQERLNPSVSTTSQ